MKFSVVREALLKPLQLVAGVVERKQTMPILANVLLELDADTLALTGSDLEIELVGRVEVDTSETGRITVPARKLLDICKSLQDGAVINFDLKDDKVTIRSNRSRFTVATLPASEFPNIQKAEVGHSFTIAQNKLKSLIEHSQYAIANQDVRYYLNGMYFEINDQSVRVAATDGHRLSTEVVECETKGNPHSVIIPRKGVNELLRVLNDSDETAEIELTDNHVKTTVGAMSFTSKLIDGRFPDYKRVIPRNNDKVLTVDKLEFRQALQRAAILSNEKYRGVRFELSQGTIRLVTNNPEQEEADETLMVSYEAEPLTIGFNINYLQDALSTISTQDVVIKLQDANGAALIEGSSSERHQQICMAMRL